MASPVVHATRHWQTSKPPFPRLSFVWPFLLPVQQVCSDSMSFDLPAGALAGSIEELGIAAEVAANKGDAPVNVFNELGGQGAS